MHASIDARARAGARMGCDHSVDCFMQSKAHLGEDRRCAVEERGETIVFCDVEQVVCPDRHDGRFADPEAHAS